MTKKAIPAVRSEQPYDRDRIDRFIDKMLGPSEAGPDGRDIRAAAVLLQELRELSLQGLKSHTAHFNRVGYRKLSSAHFSPEQADLNGPEIEIAQRQLDKEITYQQAIAELGKLHKHRGERQVQNWLAVLKKRVKASFRGLFWRQPHL